MHSTTTTFFIIVVLVAISTCYSQDGDRYTTCAGNLSCGQNFQNVGYPFWGDGRPQDCGHPSFKLKCQNNEYPTIEINNRTFRVLRNDQFNHTITIASSDLWGNYCTQELHNVTLNNSLLRYGPMNEDLFIFYNCTSALTTVLPNGFMTNFTCETGETESRGFYADWSLYNRLENSELTTCTQSLQVPVVRPTLGEILVGSLTLQEGLHRGFDVVYEVYYTVNCSSCEGSGGICGSNSSGFVCHCSDGTEHMTCQKRAGRRSNLALILGTVVSTGGITIILLLWIIVKKLRQRESMFFWKTKTENYRKIEAFLKNCGSLSPKRYTYSDIKKITDSFRTKLGQGGFGCVYKGKLENGCLVAVKVLKGLKGNGEEFVSEVATISRTSHVHIVTLLGFCFEGRHRALIYEFMPNGSLNKFIHGGGSLTNRQLGWEALFQIAVGIARGLEYLHRGCNTRILHFDIKPHNILLNEDFCPKISDFGLAKLCPQKESIISLLGVRGTVGYIAPEVFSRNFGGVSHKSDVYSYGMMVLEMVGQRKNNISVEVDHTSETYFPHWVYKRLELDEELRSDGITGDEANASTRKMIIVGLWCIQIDPSHRPSMSRVLEMLEGSLEPLQIPPKPFLSSPSRAPVDSSTTQSTLTMHTSFCGKKQNVNFPRSQNAPAKIWSIK